MVAVEWYSTTTFSARRSSAPCAHMSNLVASARSVPNKTQQARHYYITSSVWAAYREQRERKSHHIGAHWALVSYTAYICLCIRSADAFTGVHHGYTSKLECVSGVLLTGSVSVWANVAALNLAHSPTVEHRLCCTVINVAQRRRPSCLHRAPRQYL